jgi:phage host-nuclease inhibitor protein Gam
MEEDRKSSRTEISEELRTLGQRLREAFVAVREGQQSQEFRQELSRGLGELRAEIEGLLESEEVQRLGETVRGAVQEVGKGDVGQKVRSGVLVGLKELNAQIERVIQEAEEAASSEKTPPEEPSND